MRISDHVIIAPGIEHKASDIIRAIAKEDTPSYKVWYAVTSAFEQENLLYILSSMEYRLPFYHTDELKLLGLAGSRNEACDIVLELVKAGYDKDAIENMKHFIDIY